MTSLAAPAGVLPIDHGALPLLGCVALRYLALLFLIYIVAIIDRVNVGFAKLQMQQALQFSDVVYGLGAGIFFVGYFLFEIPSNMLPARIGVRKCITRIPCRLGARGPSGPARRHWHWGRIRCEVLSLQQPLDRQPRLDIDDRPLEPVGLRIGVELVALPVVPAQAAVGGQGHAVGQGGKRAVDHRRQRPADGRTVDQQSQLGVEL